MTTFSTTNLVNLDSVFAQPSEDTEIDVSESPPISLQTTNGTYAVLLDWQPESLGIENQTTFKIKLLDSSGNPVSSDMIRYDLTVSDLYLSPIAEFYNETLDHSGSGRALDMKFESPGPIEITVWVYPSESGQASESATVNLVVIPEFQSFLVMVIAAAILAAGTIVMKMRQRIFP